MNWRFVLRSATHFKSEFTLMNTMENENICLELHVKWIGTEPGRYFDTHEDTEFLLLEPFADSGKILGTVFYIK